MICHLKQAKVALIIGAVLLFMFLLYFAELDKEIQKSDARKRCGE